MFFNVGEWIVDKNIIWFTKAWKAMKDNGERKRK